MFRTVVWQGWFALTLAALLAWPRLEGVAAERAALLAAVHSITRDEAQSVVDMLADDSFEGREAGSRGGRAAGNFLMKEMETHGLIPAGENGTYFQAFNGSSRNILGLLEGRDPQLRGEVILIGAHYDHVGYGRVTNSFGPFGYVHNGADDNASGVAGLLELIEAVKQLPEAPRRSILFAFWDAEEQGLLGSYHWLASPTLPGRRVVVALNVDMIGRLRDTRLEVYGTRTMPNLRQMISLANREAGLEIDFSWKMKADSDHYPFFARGIPSLMFHTGLHRDYHRPSDDAHTINPDGIATVTQVVLLAALELAERDEAGTFREASRREHPGLQPELEKATAAPGPRFGIPFEIRGQPPQFVLLTPTPGYPAARAGLRAGDRFVLLNRRPIESEQRFRLDLLAAEGESTFTIERPGEAVPREFHVTPIGSPIRLGISWRGDNAEPQSVLLTHVVYGSAAHVAGLQHGDRIYSVNSQSFASEQQFAQLLITQSGPLEFEVERNGRLRLVTAQPH